MNRERKASEKSRKRRIHSMHNRHIDREQLQVSLGVWMIRKLIDWCRSVREILPTERLGA